MAEDKAKVRERAYELWEQAGRPEGHELEFWLKAEAESRVEAIDVGLQDTFPASDPPASGDAKLSWP